MKTLSYVEILLSTFYVMFFWRNGSVTMLQLVAFILLISMQHNFRQIAIQHCLTSWCAPTNHKLFTSIRYLLVVYPITSCCFIFMIRTFIVSLTEIFHNMILMPLILSLFLLISQLLIGTLRGIMQMSIVKLMCLLCKF